MFLNQGSGIPHTIPSWGESVKTMSFENRSLTWSFLLADIEFPILGADFLRHYRLVVDLANGQLLDAKSLECLKIGAIAKSSLPVFETNEWDEETIMQELESRQFCHLCQHCQRLTETFL